MLQYEPLVPCSSAVLQNCAAQPSSTKQMSRNTEQYLESSVLIQIMSLMNFKLHDYFLCWYSNNSFFVFCKFLERAIRDYVLDVINDMRCLKMLIRIGMSIISDSRNTDCPKKINSTFINSHEHLLWTSCRLYTEVIL